MAFIVESFVGDKAMQIGNEDIVREVSFGNNWTRVRVGVRLALNHLTYSNFAGDFKIGMTNGLSIKNINGVGAVTGFGSNYEGGSAWTVTAPAGATLPYFTSVPTHWARPSAGAMIQYFTGGSAGYGPVDPARRRSAVFADLIKASPTTLTSTWYPPNAPAIVNTDLTRSAFLQLMESESPANYSTQTTTHAFMPDQPMTHVCMLWNRSVPTWEIFDLCVMRFY